MTITFDYGSVYLCYIESYKLNKDYYGDKLLKVSSSTFLTIDDNENMIFQMISDENYCQNVYLNQKFTYFVLTISRNENFERQKLSQYLYNTNGIKLIFKINHHFNLFNINNNLLM